MTRRGWLIGSASLIFLSLPLIVAGLAVGLVWLWAAGLGLLSGAMVLSVLSGR